MRFYERWIDRTLTRLGYSKADRGTPAIGTLYGGEAPLTSPLNSYGSEGSQEKTERLAVTSAWAFSDINLISREFSRAAFNVSQKSGEGLEGIEAHPFELLMESPNQHMGRSFLWQYTMAWWQLRGEAYWWQVPDQSGELAEIWPIPANRMQPIPDAQEYIRGFAYRPRHGKPAIEIPQEHVCFFRFPNPFDFHRGLSPMSAARMALETDQSAKAWNWRTFDDNMVLQTILSLPKEMSPPNFAMVKADLITELLEKRRRFLITRAGDVDAKVLGISHKDAEFLAGREFGREEIDRIFGVPAGFWAKEATRANSEAARATLIESTVHPLHILAAETITTQIIRPRYGDDLRGAFDDIRPRNRALEVQERRTYWQVKTVDEAREDLGLEPMSDQELGATLVPIATKSQGGGEPFAEPPGQEPDQATKAARDDLRRWEGIARRRLTAGEDPGGYEFASADIPADICAAVKANLSTVTTAEEVKAAFAAGFRELEPIGWESYG